MLQFSLEALTWGLARKRANERTQRSICGGIGVYGIPGLRASAPPPAAFRSWSSSFGHDTPAHSERRFERGAAPSNDFARAWISSGPL